MRRSLVPGLVFAIVLAARLAYWAQLEATPLADWHLWRETDESSYLAWSNALAQGNWLDVPAFRAYFGWQRPSGTPEEWSRRFVPNGYFQTPLYPYLLAFLRVSFGSPVVPARLLSILLASGVAALLAATVRDLARRPIPAAAGEALAAGASVAAGLLYGLYAPSVFHDLTLGRDGLVAHLATLLVLLPLRGGSTARRALGVGLLGGVSTLAKQTLLPLGLVAAAVQILRAASGSARRRAAAAAAAGLLLPLVPLAARNVVAGVPLLLFDGRQAMTLVWANSPGTQGMTLPQPEAFRILDTSKGAMGTTVRLLAASWRGREGEFLVLLWNKLASFFNAYEKPDNANFYFYRDRLALLRAFPVFPCLLGAGLVGLVLATRARRLARAEAALLSASLLITLASSLLAQPVGRYRIGVAGPLALGAGLLVAALGARGAGAPSRRAKAVALTATAILSLVPLLPAPVPTPRHRFTDTYLYASLLEGRGDPEAGANEIERYRREGSDDTHRAWADAWAKAWYAGARPDSFEPGVLAPPEKRWKPRR